ncbi:DUF6894 family protein [Microvirga roseola]|uniref:DUF6894 family protein n=1 Tax=Microvirga roseola TaxID=2883126 RepID=UPI003898E91C
MPQYSLFIWNQHNRIKYPKSFDLPDTEAARPVALKVARVFMDVVPYWKELSPDQQNDFVVEVVDEAGETVLTVPFREGTDAEAKPS